MYSSVISNLENISESSKKEYISKSRKCQELGISIIEDSEAEIIKKLTDLQEEKRNSIMSYINVCIVIRRSLKLPYDLLVSHRNDLWRYVQNNPTETNVELLKENLPSVKDLKDFMNEQFENKDYRAYIINYLLINVNCRVLDLDITISKGYIDDTNNYLLLKNNEVIYIRNKYKTKRVYGVKTNTITDKNFYTSCRNILGSEEAAGLVENFSTVHNYTRKKLYKGMSASKYFKVIVLETDKNNLLKISNNRGTSVSTVLKSYNLLQEFY